MATTNLRAVDWTHEGMIEDGWAERIATHAFTGAVGALFAAGGAALLWGFMQLFSARMVALLGLGALALSWGLMITLLIALLAMSERRTR